MKFFGSFMFGWIKTSFQNVRIAFDYPTYEKKCRDAHLVLANSRYSTLNLEKKVNELEALIDSKAKSQFDDKIVWLSAKIRPLASSIEKNKVKLQLLERNYSEELNACYGRKKQLINKKSNLIDDIKSLRLSLQPLYEEKTNAYEQLAAACSEIESWHNKAERSSWLGGNKGRKIPNHSFFGQSFGDLESSKNDRDEARDNISKIKIDIDSLKEKINIIQSDIEHINSQIRSENNTAILIKKSRSEMFLLKKERVTKKKLKEEIVIDTVQKDQYNDELLKITAAKANSILDAKIKSGVFEMKVDIELILKDKEAFIAEFDNEEARLSRKQNHRDMWLKERK